MVRAESEVHQGVVCAQRLRNLFGPDASSGMQERSDNTVRRESVRERAHVKQ